MSQPKIILYEDEEFGGRSLELTEAIPRLEKHFFNDIISSIKVQNGTWIVYDDENFSGKCYKLTPGSYPNADSWGGKDDELSSVKPAD